MGYRKEAPRAILMGIILGIFGSVKETILYNCLKRGVIIIKGSNKIILIDERDNVVVAKVNLSKGEKILENIKIKDNIKLGFKIAIKNLKKGEKIIKYGEVIGKATKNINKGELVHVHNVGGLRAQGDKHQSGDKNWKIK